MLKYFGEFLKHFYDSVVAAVGWKYFLFTMSLSNVVDAVVYSGGGGHKHYGL